MNRVQQENIYTQNGLTDFRLRNTSDLLKVHGIDFAAVPGYDTLDDWSKQHYETFITRFLNGLGMNARMSFVPKSIYFVEDAGYYAEHPNDDFCITIKRVITAIDRNGKRKTIRTRIEENYKNLEIKGVETNKYLRIDYKINNRPEWLHITHEGTQWY